MVPLRFWKELGRVAFPVGYAEMTGSLRNDNTEAILPIRDMEDTESKAARH